MGPLQDPPPLPLLLHPSSEGSKHLEPLTEKALDAPLLPGSHGPCDRLSGSFTPHLTSPS